MNALFTAFLIVIFALGVLTGCSGDEGGKTDRPKKDYSNIETNPNIAIPGYESLDFKAGKKKQSVNFYNPDTNTCYFRLSLVLNGDGSPEEETLWNSDLLEPGGHIRSIQLERELESGAYTATLKYECFSLKDETPLNGSNVELTLNVR